MTATTLATKAKTWAKCFFSDANNIRSLCLVNVIVGLCMAQDEPLWGGGIVAAAIWIWVSCARKS